MKRIIRAVLLALLILLFAAPSNKPVGITPESCLQSLANQERTQRGLNKLPTDPQLAAAAEEHAGKMAAKEDIWHSRSTIPPGYSAWGENVAMASSCQAIHDAWMASEGHKKNILDPSWKVIGLGVVERDGRLYAVEQFGVPKKPKSDPPPKKPAPKPSKPPKPAPSCAAPA